MTPMLNIPQETERLARLVALKSGQAPEDVVREAVEQRARTLGLVTDRAARPVDMTRIDAITRRSASRPLRDQRGARDILDDAWGDPA
jgi:antitoxin VapB